MLIALLLTLLALLLAGYVRLMLRYRSNMRKATFMFDAIDNFDYTFNFPTEGVRADERLFNTSLNRIKRILQRDREETMEREKYYEAILNAVETGVMVVDGRGNILQHNHAALQLLGVETLTHMVQVRGVLTSQRFSIREAQAVLKGSKMRIIGFSDINSELSNQEVDSWVKLIRVLTHEIMNTITPVTSLSETLLPLTDRAATDPHAREELRTGLSAINKTGRELLLFVENYRKFTHVPMPHPELFYVRPFVERMARLAGSPSIEISVEPADLLVYADEGLMAHVVTNILKNAMQAIGADGHIWIHAFSDERENVVIDISNDGPLIPDDVAQHIFVPFFTTKKEGSGIGLSISRQIMRMSGGSLTLKRGGERTTFEMKL